MLLMDAGYTNPVKAVEEGEPLYVQLNDKNRIVLAWKEQGGTLDAQTARRKGKEELYGVKF